MARGLALLLLAHLAAASAARAGEAAAPGPFDPRRPPERELEMSVADGFTLAAVGDLIPSRPLAHLVNSDAGLAAVVEILTRADAAFGNLETTLIDIRSFKGHPGGGGDDWLLVAEPRVASDLRLLGFDLVSRANNHATDWGIERLRETSRLLDEAGVVHAGAGEHRAASRAARYFDTPRGRVALVSAASTFLEAGRALPPRLEAPGRPGISALRVRRTVVLPEAAMRRLAEVVETLRPERRHCGPEDEPQAPGGSGAGPGQEVVLEGARFALGERPGDFHSGLARAAIEAGADAFVGHGQHHLMPIEIYRGKPIFYSLGNFIWSDIQGPLGADMHERSRDLVARALGDPALASEADLTALWNAATFTDERVFQTVLAECRFAGGRVTEIRLHPIDLRYGERLTLSGLPRPAEAGEAAAIVERLRRLSEPLGTRIVLEKGVGVIRP